ncbi:zinc finger CCCH domain-containing protein 41-like isoform X2 [Silene latifolia]|uniref:zinc finger CCCH domain-containing protein 41-like isoform X2 n=1 Tax=Silene latifolia TaxID=37657 RepID=UPI003D782389
MSMELTPSSPKSIGLSPDSASDPDEKEISDDDDDRNHKHRKREAGSQSLERDPLEQTLTQPFRKRNRTIQNGQSDPQFNHNSNRDFSKRRFIGSTNASRFSGQHGYGRGRGRDLQWDSRFGSIDGASQIAHPGSIPPAMFSGRGLPLSNVQGASWSGFGLIPTIPNGTIDAINPLGLPGLLGPHMNPSINMGIQRQRCRDFEERGFCLRGDMCPMEHGVNRIVVEDVQSLSHFNLPVSLPSAQMLGPSAGSGFVSSTGVSSTAINSRGPHSRTNMSSVDEEALAGAVNASDVYDPDQPLWSNDARETSSPLLRLQPSNFDETVSFVTADLSDRLVQSNGDVVGPHSTSSSVWGRLKNSKNKPEVKENFNVMTKASKFSAKDIHEPSNGIQGKSNVGKQTIGAPSAPKTAGSTSNLQNTVGGVVRKPSQKAQRTLFVNCIPLKDNKRENLLSHFRKFGEVTDIYIPANSERAFVQFSKREEAEKALKAPDAVMGSRFIKLWWANRDSIADNAVRNAPITPHDMAAASGSHDMAIVNKGKVNTQHVAPKVVVPKPSDSNVTASKDFKPVVVSSPKPALPAQKKIESLELLKELRIKQEMLERKRNEFRQQLDKLTKQASINSEVPAMPAEKRQISETSSNALKVGNRQAADAGISMPSLETKVSVNNKSVHVMATSGAPSHSNRYTLDNRPTTFIIKAPLPRRLTNANALKDHFSSFGEISDVKIECLGDQQSGNDFTDSEVMTNCFAQVSFATCHAAERAFLDGKTWHGHNLRFRWVVTSIPSSSRSSGETSSALRGTLNTEVQSTEQTVDDNSQNTWDPNESNSSPPKSSDELSYSENGSPVMPENLDPRRQSEESSKDDQNQDENAGPGLNATCNSQAR